MRASYRAGEIDAETLALWLAGSEEEAAAAIANAALQRPPTTHTWPHVGRWCAACVGTSLAFGEPIL